MYTFDSIVMTTLHDLIRAHWGKVPSCQTCNRPWVAFVSQEVSRGSLYCGTQCAKDFIGMHHKRQRSTTEMEPISKIPVDVWQLVLPYVELEDLKNVKLSSADTSRKIRIAQVRLFQNYMWQVPSDKKEMQKLLTIVEPMALYVVDAEAWFNLSRSGYFERRNVLRLEFDNWEDDFVRLYQLPSSLIALTMQNCNEPLHTLPETLETLILYTYAMLPVDGYLPPKLKHLLLGDEFDESVDHLPRTLTHLTLGDDFNQPVDHLPPNLTHLTIGSGFRQSLQNLPKSITFLKVGE